MVMVMVVIVWRVRMSDHGSCCVIWMDPSIFNFFDLLLLDGWFSSVYSARGQSYIYFSDISAAPFIFDTS